MGLYVVSTGSVTLTESATKSLILLDPEKPPCKIRQIDISLGGAAAAAGVEFDIYRVETLGSPAGTSGKINAAQQQEGTSLSSALTALTTEPTAVIVLASYYLQQLGGVLPLPFPFGAEPSTSKEGARFGLRYKTGASVDPVCIANLWWEE